MGIVHRVEQLIDHPDISEEDANRIFLSTQRLLGGSEDLESLGHKFKVISIANESVVTPGFGDS